MEDTQQARWKGSPVSMACVKGWVGVQPWTHRADGKALLQPVPTPASSCIHQTKLWVRKNSAWRVTNQAQSTRSRH